jgi:hypothetical protein
VHCDAKTVKPTISANLETKINLQKRKINQKDEGVFRTVELVQLERVQEMPVENGPIIITEC